MTFERFAQVAEYLKRENIPEDESLFLYNLSRYAKALDNPRSQKDKAIEFIIAEVA